MKKQFVNSKRQISQAFYSQGSEDQEHREVNLDNHVDEISDEHLGKVAECW